MNFNEQRKFLFFASFGAMIFQTFLQGSMRNHS